MPLEPENSRLSRLHRTRGSVVGLPLPLPLPASLAGDAAREHGDKFRGEGDGQNEFVREDERTVVDKGK